MYFRNRIQIQLVLFLLYVTDVTTACRSQGIDKRSTRCILPPYPKHGSYEVAGDPAAKPGDEPEYVYLNVSCEHGHGVIGNNVVLCILGEWSTTMPECVPVCYLLEHPSVTYSCKKVEADEFGACDEYETHGASVKAECGLGYYSPTALPWMQCVNGTWTYVAQCTPECGLMPDNATLPWYAHIHRKIDKSFGHYRYRPICGGTIISPNIVVSAGHCFWDQIEETVRTSGHVVVAGKKYWDDLSDEEKFPVVEVKVTELFQGDRGNLQHDIALVILSEAFTYSRKLHPVCLDFDYEFKKKQMQEGNLGTLGLFPFPMVDQSLLQISKIPYIPVQKCIAQSSPAFRQMITGDKFCAGQGNGTWICRGNSGTGLAFPGDHRGINRYYLRGVVSTAPSTDQGCAPTKNFVTFTEVYYHKDFIKEHLATSASLPPRMTGWVEPKNFVGCYLLEHPSVTYSCKKLEADEFGACGEYEPHGASVKAECEPGYYSRTELPRMQCVNGTWTFVALCIPAQSERHRGTLPPMPTLWPLPKDLLREATLCQVSGDHGTTDCLRHKTQYHYYKRMDSAKPRT